MRILISAVGRGRNRPESTLYEFYAGRITRWSISLREQELRGQTAPAKLKAAEADLLRRPIAKNTPFVALSERGKSLDSPSFATRLNRWEEEGHGEIAFVIGGADGLHQQLLDQALFNLSLGTMTWPHLLARAMLAEQLYRAQQILTGHPYHRA